MLGDELTIVVAVALVEAVLNAVCEPVAVALKLAWLLIVGSRDAGLEGVGDCDGRSDANGVAGPEVLGVEVDQGEGEDDGMGDAGTKLEMVGDAELVKVGTVDANVEPVGVCDAEDETVLLALTLAVGLGDEDSVGVAEGTVHSVFQCSI